MFWRKKELEPAGQEVEPQNPAAERPLDKAQSFWTALLPVIACGAGLFSDGYINNVG